MRKLLFIMAIFLVAGAANVLADTEWVAVEDPNTPGIASWHIASNWNNGLPAADVKTTFGSDNEQPECVISANAVSGQTVVGQGGAGIEKKLRVADGGIWNTTGTAWTAAGYNKSGIITVDRGGQMITTHRVGIGLVGAAAGLQDPPITSYLNVNGGLVDITGDLQIGTTGSHKGIVTVNSGLLEATGWEWRDTGTPATWSFMDIRHGTVVIGGDQTGAGADDVPALIASGGLTGFGGDGTISAFYANGVTTITSTDPLNRTPAMDAVVPAGPIELSWDNVGTSPVGIAVYFGTDPENLVQQTDPNTFIDQTSVTVSAPVFDEYIWRVDTYDSTPGVDPNDPVIGDTMYFVASTDGIPEVTMVTAPTATWIGEAVTVQVTVNDDSESDVTITWSTDLADPNETWTDQVTVLPAGTVYPTVVTATIACDYVADFTVTATASDGNPLGEISEAFVNIECEADPCAAARGPLGYAADYPADIVIDCMHDLVDFAEIAEEWQLDYTILAPEPDNR